MKNLNLKLYISGFFVQQSNLLARVNSFKIYASVLPGVYTEEDPSSVLCLYKSTRRITEETSTEQNSPRKLTVYISSLNMMNNYNFIQFGCNCYMQ